VTRHLLLFLIFSSTNIFADILLSSPKIKLNAQDQRVIELKIQNADLRDGDILLKEYKTDNIIDETNIDYTLINSFESYQIFTIALSKDYDEDYFSFKISIKDSFSKDIFIFLPSKIRNFYQEIPDTKTYKTITPKKIESNKQSVSISKIESKPSNSEPQILKASEITTVWSMAKKIKGSNENISIYQIMWSIYLGNKEAFLNENINLIRKDIDIIVPSNTQIENVSYEIARDSILRMNESFSQSLKSASKSLLILTAPKIIDDVEEANNNEIKEDASQVSFDENIDPKTLIEENTRQISIGLENETLDNLLDEEIQSSNQEQNSFEVFDIIFISLISLASGALLALIFIQLRNIRNSKNIEYDFEEALDDNSTLSSMPSDLSIENNKDQQQFDLAVTYYEMNDKSSAKNILTNLIKDTEDDEIKTASQALLIKVDQ
jgi:FimV-like protein